jgi:hypothetical protein
MLAVIIPTVWLAVAMFFVILCRMAARADASHAPATIAHAPTTIALHERLSPTSALLPPTSRLRNREPLTSCRTRPARRLRVVPGAAHGGRPRS